jgi:large subunit ribosomal protein L32e
VRGLHPSGLRERLVHSLAELEGVDPEREAVRVAHRVGKKKKAEIVERAKKLGVRVLNP